MYVTCINKKLYIKKNCLIYYTGVRKMIQTVYVSSPNNQKIYVWRLDSFKSKLELMQVINTFGNAQPIGVHPNKKFLYTGVRPNFGITTYAINKEGLLSKIKNTKINNSPTYLVLNKQGTFLYCASYNYNTVQVISIDTLGIPNNTIQIIENLSGSHSANIDNSKTLLWIPCLLEHSIRLFNIHKSKGILIPNNPNYIITNPLSSPRHMAFHNIDNYAYIINELNGTIDVIKYNLKKTIDQFVLIQTIHILPNKKAQQFWSADIHITPDNNWLYCTDRFFHTISSFQILSENKKLKFVDYKYTEQQPRDFEIDSTGQFLIVAGQKSNHISLYSINFKNGKLDLISRYASGNNPSWVTIISHTNY